MKDDLPPEDFAFQLAFIDKIHHWVGGALLVEYTKMFTENGDAISKQYGGSKAMHSMEYSQNDKGKLVMEKWNNSGIFVRWYYNNISKKDVKKQQSILLFLGNFTFTGIRHVFDEEMFMEDFDNNQCCFTFEGIRDNFTNLVESPKVREIELNSMFEALQ